MTRMSPNLTPRPRTVLHRTLVVGSLAVQVLSCDDPATTPAHPNTAVDSGTSSIDADASPHQDRTTSVDRRDAAFYGRDAEMSSATLTGDAQWRFDDANPIVDTDDTSNVAPDGALPWQPTLDAQPSCDVDACNARGTCIKRDYWTECDCEPSFLPVCELPSFRVLGASRTSQEHTLYLMSADGQVVAGSHAFDTQTLLSVGVTWTPSDGLRMLEQHPDGPTIPTGINADGSLIAGYVDVGEDDVLHVVWRDGVLDSSSPDAGSLPPGNHTVAIPRDSWPEKMFDVFDATPDGAMAVGKTRRGDGSDGSSNAEAAIWLRDKGVLFLRDVLSERGVNLNRWELWHVNTVSDDGLTMMGLGIGPDVGYRWYLQLPEDVWE